MFKYCCDVCEKDVNAEDNYVYLNKITFCGYDSDVVPDKM